MLDLLEILCRALSGDQIDFGRANGRLFFLTDQADALLRRIRALVKLSRQRFYCKCGLSLADRKFFFL